MRVISLRVEFQELSAVFSPPHVALIIDTHVYGRRILSGIAHYLRSHPSWSLRLDLRRKLEAAPPQLAPRLARRWRHFPSTHTSVYPAVAPQENPCHQLER